MPLIRRFLLFCVARSFPGSTVAQFFYYLLVLYRAATQNVKPPRTFLLYMTCVGPPTTVFLPIICCWQTLFGKSWVMDQTTSRSCFQGSIKKNWLEAPLRNFAGRFQMGQTRRVLSGGTNTRLQITSTRRQSEKTLKNVVFDTSELAGDGGAR